MVLSRTISINLTFLQCGFGHDHHPARLFRSSAGAPHSSPGFLLGSLWHKRELRQLEAFATAVGSPTKKGTLFGPILEDILTRFCIRFHLRRITSIPAQSTPPKSTHVMRQLLLRAMPHSPRRLLIRRLPAQKT
jgi:hypothetical protein